MGDHNNYAVFINEVNDIFYGKSFSQIKGMIKEYKEHFPTKSYADYNFFDLDTLSSYLDYLRDLNFTIDDLSRKNRGSLTRNILNSALIANASKYNDSIRKNYIKIPTLEVNEDNKLTPSRLKGKWEQKDVWMYQNYIRERKAPKSTKVKEAVREDEQLTFRFNAPWGAKKEEPVTPVKKEDPVMPVKQNSYESDSAVERYINYKYYGKMYRLKVNEEDVYIDAQGNPVSVIKATSAEGTLFMATDLNGNVFCGDLYDCETFDLVLTALDTGETFYPNTKSLSTKKKDQRGEGVEGQMSLDDEI